MMRVNQLANLVQVTTDTVRYYSRIGLLQPTRNSGNGYKIYSDKDVHRLHFIIRAKRLGFTLSDIRKIISAPVNGKSPGLLAQQLMHERIKQAQVELDEMQNMLGRMKMTLHNWDQLAEDSTNDDGQNMDHLFEGCDGEVMDDFPYSNPRSDAEPVQMLVR